ncbi:MAG: serine hydrolase domain-containing protein [Bacteroidota bacterium]
MKQFFLFSLLFVALIGQSQNFDAATIDRLDKQIEEYVEGLSPGMAVGMVENGKIVYQNYIGYSNLEHQIAIDEKTSFNIASNAKQFTALCILQLVEQGKLSLEDDIRKFLPDLYKDVPQAISIQHLLTHTSGIRDVYFLWGLKGRPWWKNFVDNDDAMGLIDLQADLNFAPGSEYSYSNSNYILLTEIVRKVTDQEFPDFFDALMAKLGMNNTNFLTNYMAVVPHKARPYSGWKKWRENPFVTETHGDGALFTTLPDQLKWEQIIQKNDGTYLSQKLIDASQLPIPNAATEECGYGLMFDNYKGWKYSYHNGSTGSYRAAFLRFVDKNMSIVVISNNGNMAPNQIAKQLVDIVLDWEDIPAHPAGPDEIEPLSNKQEVLGRYRNDNGQVIRIVEKDGLVFREMDGRDPVELIQENGGLFQYSHNRDLKMNFADIGKEEQAFTIYLSSQRPDTYRKIPTADLASFDKDELNGHFYNEATDTKISIKFMDDNTYSVLRNDQEGEAELLFEDFLQMNSYEMKVVRDKDEKVIGLNLKNGIIKNVMFQRI